MCDCLSLIYCYLWRIHVTYHVWLFNCDILLSVTCSCNLSYVTVYLWCTHVIYITSDCLLVMYSCYQSCATVYLYKIAMLKSQNDTRAYSGMFIQDCVYVCACAHSHTSQHVSVWVSVPVDACLFCQCMQLINTFSWREHRLLDLFSSHNRLVKFGCQLYRSPS